MDPNLRREEIKFYIGTGLVILWISLSIVLMIFSPWKLPYPSSDNLPYVAYFTVHIGFGIILSGIIVRGIIAVYYRISSPPPLTIEDYQLVERIKFAFPQNKWDEEIIRFLQMPPEQREI